MVSRAIRDPWVWGQAVFLLLLGIGLPLVPTINLGPADSLLGLPDARTVRLIGAGLGLLGCGVATWGIFSLGRNLTPGVKPLHSGALVSTGAYAWVRHPMYAGVVIALAGYAWWWTNWRLALLVGWMSFGFFSAKAAAEERHLLARFGWYAEYRRRVPKMFPWGRRAR